MFQAIDLVLNSETPPDHLRPAILDLARWFNENLRSPFGADGQIARSRTWQRLHQAERKPDTRILPETRSLSWIKESATEHVSKLFHLKALLEQAGWLVEELRTTKPGQIVYEDDHQIVAIPYSDTPT
ncbi:MAG TPA: hypothetical protein VM915_02675 [Verrucomicrobiae bacterium]|nr:hypothetical protein [Verrucomicrobiae bacterium]